MKYFLHNQSLNFFRTWLDSKI